MNFFITLELIPSIISFQDPATPIMEGIIDLHNYIFFYLILVFIFVFWMYCYIIYIFYVVPTYYYDYIFCDIFHPNTLVLRNIYIRKLFMYWQQRYLPSDENVSYYGFTFMKQSVHIRNLIFVLIYRSFLNERVKNAKYFMRKLYYSRLFVHNTIIEIIWTIIPSIILVLIAIPSFTLSYAMDEIIDPKLTVKAIGYQWFWTYEYAHSFDKIEFEYLKDSLGYSNHISRQSLVYDSVMLTESELVEGYHRLLEVDHQMILPMNVHIRIMVTGADVIHSWAVPSLGVKIDAIPGRMSQIGVFIKRQGIYHGQCSELCGVNHGFMPISVKVLSYEDFISWYRVVNYVWHDYI